MFVVSGNVLCRYSKYYRFDIIYLLYSSHYLQNDRMVEINLV